MNAPADGSITELPKPDAKSKNARVITADEYFKRVRHSHVRGCKWEGDEWKELLGELGKDPLRHAEPIQPHRAVTTG